LEEKPSVTVSLSDEELSILSVKAKSYGLTIEEYIHKILSKYCSY
tara:strand:- start:71 stop:205 length:135 start_codon:yes stop_codon:yes gene_type:complete